MRINQSLIVFTLALLNASCSEPGPLIGSLPDLEHYPLAPGNTWVYEVEENEYTTTGESNVQYLVKDSIITASLDQNDNARFEIERYIFNDVLDEWELVEVWILDHNEQQLITTHNNRSILNFVYPPSDNKQWNGNIYNVDPAEIYSMMDSGNDYTTSTGETFNETVTVVIRDNMDRIVELNKSVEIYAKSVGIIERLEMNYIYCQNLECLGEEIVDEGNDYRMTLVSYELQ